jgi:hypothetical protein
MMKLVDMRDFEKYFYKKFKFNFEVDIMFAIFTCIKN